MVTLAIAPLVCIFFLMFMEKTYINFLRLKYINNFGDILQTILVVGYTWYAILNLFFLFKNCLT